MHRTVILIVMLVLCSGSALAQERLSAGATIDAHCRRQEGRIVVPSGMKAVRLRAELNSSWLPCGGAGQVARIGFRILSPTGAILVSVVNPFGSWNYSGAEELGKLELAPGSYAIEISDGGKQTNATVSWELIPATQPTAGTIPAEAKAVAARGEPAVIGGEWRDPEVGSRAIIKQEGARIYVINSFLWKKQRVEWQGHGTFDGKVARFEYAYTATPPEGWKNGTMELTLVDGRTLKGFWKSEDGIFSRNITLQLVKPDRKR